MRKQIVYSVEVRERAARMALEQERHSYRWRAIRSITSRIGCLVEELERENRELKRTNEILRRAVGHVAPADLDGQSE